MYVVILRASCGEYIRYSPQSNIFSAIYAVKMLRNLRNRVSLYLQWAHYALDLLFLLGLLGGFAAHCFRCNRRF
jgi:hypothetical protein